MKAFTDKISNTVSRTTQQVKVKLGKADETVDIQMNQEVQKFKTHYKHVQKIKDNTKKFLSLLKDMAKAQSELTETLQGFYESSDPMYQATVQMQYCMQDIDAARLALEEQWRDDFQVPLSEYVGQFNELDKRIDIRNGRRLDMDRFREEVKAMTEKGNQNPAKLNMTKEKLAHMQEAYKELNSELMKDIPALYMDRTKFFTPVLATMLDSYIKYYTNCNKSLQGLVPYVGNVDKSAAHTHPAVITDKEISTAYRDPATFAISESFYDDHGSSSTHASPQVVAAAPVAYSHPPSQQHAPPQAHPVPQQYHAPPQQHHAPPQQHPVGRPVSQGPPGHGAAPAPIPRSLPVAPMHPRARALYPFAGQDASELTFKFNDIIVIRKREGEWWEGEMNGRVGLLPSNYVQIID